MSEILIHKNDKQIGKINYDKYFPTKQQIQTALKNFGHGEFELEAPNGRRWKVVMKDLTSYLSEV